MAKLNHLFSAIFFLTTCLGAGAQSYALRYRSPEGDSVAANAALQRIFASRNEAGLYIYQLPSLLQGRGYLTASVDSVRYDSLSAQVVLFLGEQYRWAQVNTRAADEAVLEAIRWPQHALAGNMDFTTLHTWQQKILDYLEENGHPFGKVYLDSIGINGSAVRAVLAIDQGPLYKVDSIRVFGNVKVKNDFLQRYLDMPNGSIYNKKDRK